MLCFLGMHVARVRDWVLAAGELQALRLKLKLKETTGGEFRVFRASTRLLQGI